MSSSSASSRGTRNQFQRVDISNYQLINKSTPPEKNYEGLPIFCNCKLKAVRWCSWKYHNVGRRFYGCHYFPDFDCKFLLWHDPPVSDRAKEVIYEMRNRERVLVENVKDRDDQLAFMMDNVVEGVEAEVIQENFKLKNEVCELKKKLKDMEENAGRNGSFVFNRKCFILIAFSVFFVFVFNVKQRGNMHVQDALP